MTGTRRCRARGAALGSPQQAPSPALSRVLGCLTVAVAVLLPSAAHAQAPAGFGYTAHRDYPHQSMVGASIRIPVGSADDPDGSGGSAWLLGQIRVLQMADRLDPSDGVVTVEVDRSATVYTVLALPEAWEKVWEAVEDVVFRAPIPEAVFEEARTDLIQQLGFEAGSPVVDFVREAAGLRAPLGSPWARPIRGEPNTLYAITPAALDAFRRSRYRPSDAAVAVVGAVGSATPHPSGPAPERPDVPWLVGDRVSMVQEVTSTWISVAWPVPSTVGRTDLELVAQLLLADLDPTPPRPDRFGVSVSIEDTPGGTVLLIEASVVPDAAATWEARIVGAVDDLRGEAMAPDFFAWSRRRFRARRILSEGAPEAQAGRMAADLLRIGAVRDLGAEIWELSPESLLAAARALGEPRIFVLGADLGS